MDNQHKLIKGYRDLSPEEIAAMNDIKASAESVGEMVFQCRERILAMPARDLDQAADRAEARRWLDAAELQLQQGFMLLTRAIARPTTF